MQEELTRRDAIRVGSAVFMSGTMAALANLLSGCTGGSSGSSSSSGSGGTTTSSSSCLQSTNVTRGPYFLDDRADANIQNDVVDSSIPQRSDIRPDSKGSTGTQQGLPLALTINVGSYSSGACSAIANAQVHIWHCNAQGIYSDVQASSNGGGTDYTGENFLRGYQFTDSNGQVQFTTIYPGWYSGRSVHIHVKVRIFDSSGNVTTEATTQLFFDESVTSAVYAANSAYSKSGTRILNANDGIFSSESPALMVGLSGSASSGYTGTVSIGITTGTIFGG